MHSTPARADLQLREVGELRWDGTGDRIEGKVEHAQARELRELRGQSASKVVALERELIEVCIAVGVERTEGGGQLALELVETEVDHLDIHHVPELSGH